MSFPHFFNADPYYQEQIEGMSPNKEKHQFSMTLEEVLFNFSLNNFN